MIVLITAEQLSLVAVSQNGLKITVERCRLYVDLLNSICPRYGINTVDIFHEFIAQLLHESDCFRARIENMNYSAEAIVRTWPGRFKNTTQAQTFARNPQKLANMVYGKRMGNVKENDGWEFRGSGPIQLTGRGNVTACWKYMVGRYKDAPTTVENFVGALRTDDRWGIEAACWFYAVEKKLIALSIADNFLEITKRVNGGTNGLADRQYYYERAKKYIPLNQAV